MKNNILVSLFIILCSIPWVASASSASALAAAIGQSQSGGGAVASSSTGVSSSDPGYAMIQTAIQTEKSTSYVPPHDPSSVWGQVCKLTDEYNTCTLTSVPSISVGVSSEVVPVGGGGAGGAAGPNSNSIYTNMF